MICVVVPVFRVVVADSAINIFIFPTYFRTQRIVANRTMSHLYLLFRLVCMVALLKARVAGQGCESTPSDMLGPFYLPNSEVTTSLAPESELNDSQLRLDVSGTVYTSTEDSCVGLADATVEVWYAGFPNDNGYEDNEYRGQMSTDADGKYSFAQKFPSLYPSRPILHDHFRISKNGKLLLVTQLYFYGEGEGYVSPLDTTQQLQTEEVSTNAIGRRVEFDIFVENVDGNTSISSDKNSTDAGTHTSTDGGSNSSDGDTNSTDGGSNSINGDSNSSDGDSANSETDSFERGTTSSGERLDFRSRLCWLIVLFCSAIPPILSIQYKDLF